MADPCKFSSGESNRERYFIGADCTRPLLNLAVAESVPSLGGYEALNGTVGYLGAATAAGELDLERQVAPLPLTYNHPS